MFDNKTSVLIGRGTPWIGEDFKLAFPEMVPLLCLFPGTFRVWSFENWLWRTFFFRLLGMEGVLGSLGDPLAELA
jgi:hypothetical protein